MKSKLNYLDQLIAATREYNSIMCAGLDPVLGALPKKFHVPENPISGFYLMLLELFDYMKEQKVYPGAFKPNKGFYSKHNQPRLERYAGSKTLASVITLIEKEFPGMPTILDPKLGDIGKSSQNYAEEVFDGWEVNATTVAPYMGTDSIVPFANYCLNGHGVYVLDRTSNPGADDFQTKKIDGGEKLYMLVADWIRRQAKLTPGIGAVVGAPNLADLQAIAAFYAEAEVLISLLIPGVGGQGGSALDVSKTLRDVSYDMNVVRINISSGFTHPWGEKNEAPGGDDWKKVIVETLHDHNVQTGMA